MVVNTKDENNRPLVQVIVRGWGDQPVDLYLYHVEKQRDAVFVAKLDAKRAIGLPSSQVFHYDRDLYQIGLQAWRDGDTAALGSFYARLDKRRLNLHLDTY